MKDNLELTCIVLWIISLTRAQEARVERRFACWGSAGPPVVSAQCPRDTVLHIIRAGLKVQTSGGRCEFQESDCGCTFEEPGCQMPDVRDLCMGKPACRLDVTQQYIGTGRCHGFSDYMYIEFKCVQVTQDASHDVCKVGNLQHSSGFLQSPNHPNPYPDNRHCECTLSATDGATIDIQILDLQLKDKDCDNDYLSLEYNEQETMFCGQSNGLRESISTGAHDILLNFHTDNEGGDNGFWIKYQAQPRHPIRISCVSTIIESIESNESDAVINVDPTPSSEIIWTISTRSVPIPNIDVPENLIQDENKIMENTINQNNNFSTEHGITSTEIDKNILALGIENLPKVDSNELNTTKVEGTESNEAAYIDDIIISEINFVENNPQYEDINIFETEDYKPVVINENFRSGTSPEQEFNNIVEPKHIAPSETDIRIRSNEIDIIPQSTEQRYIEVGDYFYQPNMQLNNRRRISRLNLQRFRDRMRMQHGSIIPNDIDIHRNDGLINFIPNDKDIGGNEIIQESTEDIATNDRIENARLDFELFANDLDIQGENNMDQDQPPLQGNRVKEWISKTQEEPVIDKKQMPSRIAEKEDSLVQNPKDNIQNEIHKVPPLKTQTTPWWWQYTAKTQPLPSTISPIKDRRAKLKLNRKNNGASLESHERAGHKQGVIKNQSVIARNKLLSRNNVQGDVLQNVEENSKEEPSRFQTQQPSATVTAVAVGVIALIVLIIIIGIAVRWALNKREAKRAWRKRHRKECALRQHAARQSARR